MSDTPNPTLTEHELSITRVLEAPRELVWTCWTDPEHFAAWFGPEHFTTPVDKVEIDLRPGGVFKSTMVGPDGSEHPNDGVFEEITPPERLVFAETDIDHPMVDSQRTTVTLTDLGDGRTELRLDVTMVCVDELVPMAKAGWSSSFDKLAAVLAGS